MALDFTLKRIYEPAADTDGQRVLVDRMWPRGISKEKARLTLWLKAIAPSVELCRWFDHSAERWEEFRWRYFAELDRLDEPVRQLEALLEQGHVTLLYAAHEQRYNNALALADYLNHKNQAAG
jgi:uncharacterized protein YeaO (DUF488 family)